MTRLLVGVLAGMFLTMALTARAATPATAATAATTQAANVTPDAADVIKKLGQTYAKLKSLDLSGKLSGDFDVAGQKKNENAPFNSTYASPNQFRHEIKNEAI